MIASAGPPSRRSTSPTTSAFVGPRGVERVAADRREQLRPAAVLDDLLRVDLRLAGRHRERHAGRGQLAQQCLDAVERQALADADVAVDPAVGGQHLRRAVRADQRRERPVQRRAEQRARAARRPGSGIPSSANAAASEPRMPGAESMRVPSRSSRTVAGGRAGVSTPSILADPLPTRRVHVVHVAPGRRDDGPRNCRGRVGRCRRGREDARRHRTRGCSPPAS